MRRSLPRCADATTSKCSEDCPRFAPDDYCGYRLRGEAADLLENDAAKIVALQRELELKQAQMDCATACGGRLRRQNEELLAAAAREWIPVTERLPENEKPVLVFVGYADSMIGFMTVSTYFAFEPEPHWQWDGLVKDREQKTLFWMPLPEAPEKRERRKACE